MATKAVKPSAKKDSIFWNPQEGDSISGTFLQWEKLKGGKFADNNAARLGLRLLTKGGEKLVDLSFALMDLFRAVYPKMKAGDKVEIEYLEKVKIKGGRSVKEFRAAWKGKELERTNDFGKPAEASEVADLFKA